jgi:predicted RNase H-like HicB family nuclease
MKYAIVIEKAKRNFSAYVPDLPGCISTGGTLDETVRLMQEAMEYHIESMLQDGDAVPAPTTQCREVEIDLDKIAETVRAQAGSS